MKCLKNLLTPLFIMLSPALSLAQGAAAQGSSAVGMGYLACGIAVGGATLGAGVAVGAVGSAAMGLVGEKPELIGRALIFIGLAEGLAIYGLIVALMILARL